MGDKNAAAGASLNALRAHQVQVKKETSSAYRVPNVREQALAGLAGCSRPVVPLMQCCHACSRSAHGSSCRVPACARLGVCKVNASCLCARAGRPARLCTASTAKVRVSMHARACSASSVSAASIIIIGHHWCLTLWR